MGKHVHILSEIDSEQRTATCAHCGPVSINKAGKIPLVKWKCATADRARKRKQVHSKGGKKDNLGHGLTVQEAQEYRRDKECEICGSTDRLVVDHCHTSLVIRGVLCSRCNVAIGFMEDSPERLRKAANYLESKRA